MSTELWTADQLARHMRVSPRTVQRWCRERIVPHVRVNGRTIRFTASQVAEITEAFTVQPAATVDVFAANPSYYQHAVVVPITAKRGAL